MGILLNLLLPIFAMDLNVETATIEELKAEIQYLREFVETQNHENIRMSDELAKTKAKMRKMDHSLYVAMMENETFVNEILNKIDSINIPKNRVSITFENEENRPNIEYSRNITDTFGLIIGVRHRPVVGLFFEF